MNSDGTMEYVEGTWNLVSCGGHLGPPATHSGTCSVVPWPSPAVREQGVGMGWDGWSWKASYVPRAWLPHGECREDQQQMKVGSSDG